MIFHLNYNQTYKFQFYQVCFNITVNLINNETKEKIIIDEVLTSNEIHRPDYEFIKDDVALFTVDTDRYMLRCVIVKNKKTDNLGILVEPFSEYIPLGNNYIAFREDNITKII